MNQQKPRFALRPFPILLAACVASLAWRSVAFTTVGDADLAEPTATAQAAAHPTLELEDEQLQQLDDELRATLADWERRIERLQPVDPTDPDDIEAEALARLGAEEARSARAALASGRLRAGRPETMGSPRHRAWWTQVLTGDGPLDVHLILDFEEHPALRDGQLYFLTARDAALRLRAEQFNELPDTERFAIRDRLAALEQAAQLSTEDRQFRRQHLPPGLLMVKSSARLATPDTLR